MERILVALSLAAALLGVGCGDNLANGPQPHRVGAVNNYNNLQNETPGTILGNPNTFVDVPSEILISSITGKAAKALDYTVKIPGQGASTPNGWWLTSSTLPSNGNITFSTVYEYPTRIAASQAVLTVIVVHNSMVSDTEKVQMTRNTTSASSPNFIGSGVTITSSTAPGTVLGEIVSVSSGAIGDTYGLTSTGTGSDTSGNVELIGAITLN